MNRNKPFPVDDARWEVIEVVEGGKTWYELHKGALVLNRDYTRWQPRSLKRAMRYRDKLRKRDADEQARTERIIP